VKISEAGAEEKDERCDVFPDGTGDAGRTVTSAGCVGYISFEKAAETAGWNGAKGSYSAERAFGVCDDLGLLRCCILEVDQSLVVVVAWTCDSELVSSSADPDIGHAYSPSPGNDSVDLKRESL
jgi:hypothetical protein